MRITSHETPLQILPMRFAPDLEAHARGWAWRIARAWPGERCTVVEVSATARDAPAIAAFIDPFDLVRVRAAGVRWARGSRRHLWQQIATLDGAWSELPLASLGSLTVPLWPHQLAPALALVRGRAARLLVADEVGLGKTLSAALILVELHRRGLARRALVVTPAGLRDQWQHELADRAALDAEVVDAAALARRAGQRPQGESPWSVPGIAIVSTDFARQPGILAGLTAAPWDLLIVDEAHQVSGDSARAAALSRIAQQSRVVVLLSATPHSGDPGAYRRLLTLGGADTALRFRHTRGAAVAHRQTRRWKIRATRAETRLLDALTAYARRVERAGAREARLAMIVLRKRALSSAEALARSLWHRREALGDASGAQLSLPLDPDPGEHDDSDDAMPPVLATPGLANRAGELAELQALIDLAHAASAASSKRRAVLRALRRTTEPIILFTEFRDTLHAVARTLGEQVSCVLLHGGLERRERLEAVTRFTNGEVRVLIATDAAAEGLNLQARCRLLVNFELPWSPRVLEQRAGRIDRIGQSRRVHVWELAGRSGHEAMVAAALARRLDAIERGLACRRPDADPRASTDEDGAPVCEADPPSVSGYGWWRLGAAARQHLERHGRQRRSRRVPWIRARGARAELSRGVLIVFTAHDASPGGAPQHVAVHVALRAWPPGNPSEWLPGVIDVAKPFAASHLRSDSPLRSRLLARERELVGLAQVAGDRAAKRWQASLFDRRAERVVQAARRDLTRLLEEHEQRIAALSVSDTEPALEPSFALLVSA